VCRCRPIGGLDNFRACRRLCLPSSSELGRSSPRSRHSIGRDTRNGRATWGSASCFSRSCLVFAFFDELDELREY
jgi:hypothetical protein